MRIFRTIKQNWAKTSCCTPEKVIYPSSEAEIIELLQACNATNKKLKVVGGGHSYNDIFCPDDGYLLSLEKMNHIESIDTTNNQVTFQAGVMMPDLIKALKKEGLSVSNLGTNVFDNLAGACSTGYHGSGINYQIFSSFVVAF